eukprot:TRINITY_DN5253_c0_g1_i1.p1 TRINITY_DN5253_c0_g1~~TRINITY_DN5253_c0_g1_i1.p1  ORF type:complete len:191 (+),score=21.99 TRINITY_DN5253_c0_g1_i1:45-617(+)
MHFFLIFFFFFFFQAEDGIRDHAQSRGLGDVYKRQTQYFLLIFRSIVFQIISFYKIVCLIRQFPAADGLFTKWKEGKLANHKAGLTPGDANNGQKAQEADKPPAQPHQYPAEDEPQEIADCAHEQVQPFSTGVNVFRPCTCLLYTSDAADDMQCVDLGGRRIIKKKKKTSSTGVHRVKDQREPTSGDTVK